MLWRLLQPSMFSATIVQVLYTVNDAMERSLLWRLVCANLAVWQSSRWVDPVCQQGTEEHHIYVVEGSG